MRKVDSVITRLTLTGIMAGMLFPATLSAYIITDNDTGKTVTLEASDRTSDNTALIQGFLNNVTYTKIIIPPGPGNASWPVCPLFFNHSNTEVHLNANAVLETKTGGYPLTSDCVLRAAGKDSIKVTGDAGSKILMHKAEYAAGESRMVLRFDNCSNVTISGSSALALLTLADAGGDGIYLADGCCSHVTIANVVTDGCARNGLTVISVAGDGTEGSGLKVTNCTFKNTVKTGNLAPNGPWAGIDLEPNNILPPLPPDKLQDILIDSCVFLNNGGPGVQLYTPGLNGSTGKLNVTVKNCTMQGNATYGIIVARVPASLDDSSSIAFQNCAISNNNNSGIWVSGKARDAGTLSFTDCTLINNNLTTVSNTAVLIKNYSDTTAVGGNIQLNNLVVVQPTSRLVNYFLSIDGTYASIDNVSGNLYASGGLLSVVNTTNLDVTTASNALPTPPSTSNFLHYWKMDETSGCSTAYDSVGSCNGILQNNPAWAIGRIGGGLALNGTNQFVTVANDPSLNIGTGDFSISLWMQRSDDSSGLVRRLLYKGANSDSEIGYALCGVNSWLELTLCNGVTRLSTACSIPSLNQWHHMVFTIDRASGKVMSYVDGIYQGQTDISSYNGVDISNNSINLLIGAARSDGWLAWPGAVDDVRIYKRVLTPGEIAYLAAGASACWQFDDSYGSGVIDCIGRSPGMLQNNPTWITTGKFSGALALNGVNQFVSVSNNSSDLNIGTGDFSISLWMQRSDSAVTNSRLFYKGANADTEIGYALCGSNTALVLVLSRGVSTIPRITLYCAIPSLNQWHHFVFTINRVSGKAKAYVDGVCQSTALDISSYNGVDISNNSINLLIGAARSDGWLPWPGAVDDVRIYKRVLSADEVLQLYSTP